MVRMLMVLPLSIARVDSSTTNSLDELEEEDDEWLELELEDEEELELELEDEDE